MGGACSKMGGACTGFSWGNLRGRDYLEDTGVDGRIILIRIFTKWALLNAVVNIRVL